MLWWIYGCDKLKNVTHTSSTVFKLSNRNSLWNRYWFAQIEFKISLFIWNRGEQRYTNTHVYDTYSKSIRWICVFSMRLRNILHSALFTLFIPLCFFSLMAIGLAQEKRSMWKSGHIENIAYNSFTARNM